MPTPDELTPSVNEVALLLRTRTTGPNPNGGLGGDTGPGDVTTFTDKTRPTAAEVASLIQTALGNVMGAVATPIPDIQAGRVKHAVALYTAILIEASFFREQVGEGSLGVWQALYDKIIGEINESIEEGAAAAGSFGMIVVRADRTPPRTPPADEVLY